MKRGSERIISQTNFVLPGQKKVYHGKVRDVYDLGDSMLMVTTDRYSAFDRNLALVPHKGELLVGLSRWWFEQTKHIVKNHVKGYPDPNVMWCNKYDVVPIEMIVRGYITGVTNTSLWHTYSQGQRDYGNFKLPDGLHKNQRLPEPVLTPTTKFEVHDRNLTPQQAVDEGLVDKKVWDQMQDIALKLFNLGQKTAEAKGLMLVDTKYEFGLDKKGQLVLIDELHTQDSCRYWLADTYKQRIAEGQEPDNYDKEYLRLWFKQRFDPYQDKQAPKAPAKITNELSRRYIYVYEHLTGQTFKLNAGPDPVKRIENNLMQALKKGI